MPVKSFDQQVFDEIRGVMGDSFSQILTIFLEDATDYVSLIRQGADEGDFVKVYQAAHPLKSSSAGLGLLLLSELSKELEAKARGIADSKEDNVDIGPLVDGVENAFSDALQLLKGFCN